MQETGQGFSDQQVIILLVGNIVAFLVAMVAIKSFISFLTKHGFRVFGYYRIAIGIVIVVLYIAGIDLKIT
jgi:undecaprenyl-diphosphatase